MNNETSWIIVDIDGTLADSGWRIPIAPDWDDYHSQSIFDAPYKDTISLLQYLQHGFNIALVTRRNAKWRHVTMKWLRKHHVPYQELIMPNDDDFRSSTDIKKEVVEMMLKERDILFALEDDPKIVEMYRGLGISTFHVRESQTV